MTRPRQPPTRGGRGGFADMKWMPKADTYLAGNCPQPRVCGCPGHRFVENRRDDAAMDDILEPLVLRSGDERGRDPVRGALESKTKPDRIFITTPETVMVRSGDRRRFPGGAPCLLDHCHGLPRHWAWAKQPRRLKTVVAPHRDTQLAFHRRLT